MRSPARRPRIAIAILAVLLPTDAVARDEASTASRTPLKALILTGGGGSHDWRSSSAILRQLLSDSGRFDVRVCESPVGLTARTLAGFDVVLDDYAGPPLGDESESAIATFVRSGKGLVVAHGAIGAMARRSGHPDPVAGYESSSPTGKGESGVRFLQIRVHRPEHPIVRGMPSTFRTAEALPMGLVAPPGSEVIAVAETGKGNGDDAPALMVSRSGEGRICTIALGHDASAMHESWTTAAYARGTEWAATGNVTLPADLGSPRPDGDAIRGLVITGGHDHDAAFYGLFDGYKVLSRLPVLTAPAAFRDDIRKKYDVLIMYDFTRDLDDAGMKNLRDFVESGGGVVVLHHALLNYQEWPWWSEQVVGGRYRLRREGGFPSSSVKDDQQIFVKPAGDHPVTAGIGPFHIVDEAYKNLYMSPRIRPLLTTDNPTSDTNLAWLGPEERYRVVAIQLGHGRSAFGHPSYRRLVHNAILWAARKS